MRVCSEIVPFGNPFVLRKDGEVVCFLIVSYAIKAPPWESAGGNCAKIGGRRLAAMYYTANGDFSRIIRWWNIDGTKGLVLPMAEMGPLLNDGYSSVLGKDFKKAKKKISKATRRAIELLEAEICDGVNIKSAGALLEEPILPMYRIVNSNAEMEKLGFHAGDVKFVSPYDQTEEGETILEMDEGRAYLRFGEFNENFEFFGDLTDCFRSAVQDDEPPDEGHSSEC